MTYSLTVKCSGVGCSKSTISDQMSFTNYNSFIVLLDDAADCLKTVKLAADGKYKHLKTKYIWLRVLLTCKYCPSVSISTSIALKSAMASFNSSSDSPRPNIIEVFVIIPFLLSFAWFRTDKLCLYLHYRLSKRILSSSGDNFFDEKNQSRQADHSIYPTSQTNSQALGQYL